MAKQFNIHNLVVNVDSSDVVRLITSSIKSSSPIDSGRPTKQLTLLLKWVVYSRRLLLLCYSSPIYVGCIIFW